jgi:tRNA threonylcarbamoyladenosine biosynthesis protein TsaB
VSERNERPNGKSLTLLLETSSGQYSAALLDQDAPAELLEYRETDRRAADYDGVPGLAEAVLNGRSFRELGMIVVDAGPGNLTSVRSGVAWANALAYSAGVRLLGPNSLELLCLSVHQAQSAEGPEPVLVLRKAGGTTVYAGLFADEGAEPVYAVGELADVVKRLAGELPAFTVAGAFRDRVPGLLPETPVTDSGLELPTAHAAHLWLLERASAVPNQDLLVPLTENSELFRD